MIRNLSSYVRQPQFLSIGLVFALHAILFSLWVTRLPEVKDALQLSEADLGICLFFMPFGAFTAMVIASPLIRNFGAGKVTIGSAMAYFLAILLPLTATSGVWLAAALYVVGVCAGINDIAMNAVAAALEKIHKKVIMATTHGFFSLGGMVGAFAGATFIGMEIDGFAAMAGGVVGCFLVLGLIQKNISLVVGEEEKGGKLFVFPGKAVLGLAIIAFCTMMGEGAVSDWSSIYLKDIALAEGAMIGMGYAGFSLAMTLGRFYGDILIDRLGSSRIVLLGSMFAIVGLLSILVGETISAIIGFTLVGLGYSSIIPVAFSEAAKSDQQSASRGITAVISFGYIGFLSGPVVIGLISEWGGLKLGMIFLLLTAVITLLVSWKSVKTRPVSVPSEK